MEAGAVSIDRWDITETSPDTLMSQGLFETDPIRFPY